MAKVKGIIFTFSLTIFAFIILTLAIIISGNIKNFDEREEELIALSRIYNLDNSIQNGFREIFNKKSGITVATNNKNITISDFLPNPNIASFNNETAKFKNFVESNFNNVIIDAEELNEVLILSIIPHNINYTNDKDKTIILNHDITASSYEFYFWNDTKNGTVKWNKFSQGNVNVKVVAESIGWHSEETKTIDPSEENKIEINGLGGGKLEIKIEDNVMEIENEASSQVLFKATISFNETAIVYIPNIINIYNNELNISKTSGIRLY